MANARDSVLPDSWGAGSDSSCSSTPVSSFTGSYASATATAFPSASNGVASTSSGVASNTASSASNAKRNVKVGGPAWLKRDL